MFVQMCQTIFEEDCKTKKQCKKIMSWSMEDNEKEDFGMIPPIYRDVWLKNY